MSLAESPPSTAVSKVFGCVADLCATVLSVTLAIIDPLHAAEHAADRSSFCGAEDSSPTMQPTLVPSSSSSHPSSQPSMQPGMKSSTQRSSLYAAEHTTEHYPRNRNEQGPPKRRTLGKRRFPPSAPLCHTYYYSLDSSKLAQSPVIIALTSTTCQNWVAQEGGIHQRSRSVIATSSSTPQ